MQVAFVLGRSLPARDCFRVRELTRRFSAIVGKQQWLANGDILVTDAMCGPAFEISPRRQAMWDYSNQTGQKGVLGLLTEATRIPPDLLSASKLQELASKCPKN